MIRIDGHLTVNPAMVSTLRWERHDYVNGPSEHTLVITMASGVQHRVYHGHGTDAFKIEKDILTASGKP